MTGILEGKCALVTGGASGIGRAAALAMAREGARVAVADRTEEMAAATVAAINAGGGQAIAIACLAWAARAPGAWVLLRNSWSFCRTSVAPAAAPAGAATSPCPWVQQPSSFRSFFTPPPSPSPVS